LSEKAGLAPAFLFCGPQALLPAAAMTIAHCWWRESKAG